MDTRNFFTVEELDFLSEVQKDIECFTRQEIDNRIKYGMQEEIEEETEEEIEEETEEEIVDESEEKIKEIEWGQEEETEEEETEEEVQEEIEEETEEEIEDETEEKIKELDYHLFSMKMPKTIYVEEVEEEIEDETEEKINYHLVSMKTPKTISAEEVEEEIEDETEEKINYHLVSMKTPKTISAEEVEEELYSSNYEEFEESSSCDCPLSDLQKDKDTKAALEKELRIRRAEIEMKEAPRRKQKENHALSKASKKDQTAHLRRSEKDQEHRYAKRQKQKSKMTADLKEKDELVEKFKAEQKGNCEVSFQGQKTIKELKQANEDLKRKFLEKDNEIKSLHISFETLQNSSEAKSSTISVLQERVDQWASGLKEERAKHYKLQRDYEAALSQQHKDKEELIHLTFKNQQLALEQKRLQGELKDDHKRQRAQDNQWTAKLKQEQGKNNKLQKELEVALSQQQKDREKLMLMPNKNLNLQKLEQKRPRGEFKDDPKRELAQDNQWTLKLKQEQGKNDKLQKDLEVALSQQQKDREELMLLTSKNQKLALDKKSLQVELEDVQLKRELSLIQLKKDRETCNMLEEKLRKYKTRLSREIKQNEQQKKASTATESKMNNMHTLRMENEDIMAKFEAKDRSKSTTLAQLEDALHKETVQRSILEERTVQIASALERERERAKETFSALERERERANKMFSALERERERANKSSSALEKERATCDRCRVELKEGLTRQKKEQTNPQVRQPEQRAQHNPQRQHTDLGRKQINSNFHELRVPPPTSRTTKSRSALQKGSPAHHSVGLSRTQRGHHSA